MGLDLANVLKKKEVKKREFVSFGKLPCKCRSFAILQRFKFLVELVEHSFMPASVRLV